MPEQPPPSGGVTAGPGVPDGDFPFPLPEGPRESEYLTWLRNHSNYMAAQGFLDYFRAGAVLVRGVIVNLLIFIPLLLLVAIVLALAHHWMLAHPFRVTLGAAALGIGWILIFPALTRIFGLIMHGRIVQTGSASSVKLRDRYERSFGFFLLSLCGLAALESLPWVLEFFYDQVQLGTLTWTSGLATVGGALAVLSGSNRLLAVLSGVKKQVALVLVGTLGVLIPLAVVLTAAGYLLYGLPPSFLWMLSPLAILGLGALAIVLLMPLALWNRAFTLKEALAVLGMLAVSLVMGFGVYTLSNIAMAGAQEGREELGWTLQKMAEVVSQFEHIPSDSAMSPELASLVGAGVRTHRRYVAARKALETPSDPQEPTGPFGWVRDVQAEEASRNRELKIQLPLVSLGYRLSRLSDAELEPLRQAIRRRAHEQLLVELELTAAEQGILGAELLAFVLAELSLWPTRGGGSASLPRDDLGLATPPPTDEDPVPWVQRRFEQLAANPALHEGLERARDWLSGRETRHIRLFVTEADLATAVERKFHAVPGMAEGAQLGGKDSLVRLLTKAELAGLVFPADSPARSEWLHRWHREWLLQQALAELSNPEEDRPGPLVVLAAHGQRAPRGGMADSLALALGFHATPTRFIEPLPAASSASDGPATEKEIARAAGALLADHELQSIDADYLRPLAFALSPIDDLSRFRDRTLRADRSLAPELDEFLELARLPLADLAARARPTEPEQFQPFEDRTDSARRAAQDRLPAFWPDHYRYGVLLAIKALDHDTQALARRARGALLERALLQGRDSLEYDIFIDAVATYAPDWWDSAGVARIAAARVWADSAIADELASSLLFGEHGSLGRQGLAELKEDVTGHLMGPKLVFVGLLIVVIALLCWFTVDVNLTSVNGLYRDRLASAFLVGKNTKGDVDIEEDIDLAEICRYEARSSAPYHLINTALNLQGSKNPNVRGRKSDFFIFSKRFIGGPRTGYCRSEVMEQVFPQIDLGTAMAISAAAAAPNMGRATSPLLVAFMTLLNVRLGYWVPNPGRLEAKDERLLEKLRAAGRRLGAAVGRLFGKRGKAPPEPGGFRFEEVFAEELWEIARRREVYRDGSRPTLETDAPRIEPTVGHGLAGIGFSGGGIRSAALNLGITQALDQRGVFKHLDYMSTVSGGGYLGSSISALMRTREKLKSEVTGRVEIRGDSESAEGDPDKVVTVVPDEDRSGARSYRFSSRAELNVEDGMRIEKGDRLLRRTAPGTQGERFRWRVRPSALVREIRSKLDETHRWVNLSDGGHIENLAGIELLRRRCKYVIIGDGECDPNLHFGGLAKLMRYASLDLGIEIDLNVDTLRLTEASQAASKQGGDPPFSCHHWVAGTIEYPPGNGLGEETGYLLYLKSSFTGNEPEPIQEYRHRHPAFPHQSTADQAFDEDQFEAYRALGQHIAEDALELGPPKTDDDDGMSFSEFKEWFQRLMSESKERAAKRAAVKERD